MPDQAPDSQAREFAVAFRGFLDWIHSAAAEQDNEVSVLVRDFLGPDGTHHSVVTRDLPPFEHVNLQTAIDAWSARAGRTVEVHGVAMPPHYGGLSLQQLVAGEGLPPLRLMGDDQTWLGSGVRQWVIITADQAEDRTAIVQALPLQSWRVLDWRTFAFTTVLLVEKR